MNLDLRPATSLQRIEMAKINYKQVLIGLVILVLVWEIVPGAMKISPRQLPKFSAVIDELGEPTPSGWVWNIVVSQMVYTALESLAVLVVGVSIGVLLALLVTRSWWVEAAIWVYIRIAATMPVMVLIPLIIAVVGADWWSQVLVASFIVFLPTAVATKTGLESIPATTLWIYDTGAAPWWRKLVEVEIPYSFSFFLAGLESSAVWAVYGAIMAEMPFGDQRGLSAAMMQATKYTDMERLILYVLINIVVGIIVVSAVIFVTNTSIFSKWRKSVR